MSIIKINHHPGRRELAVFSAAWAVFFAAVGGAALARSGSWVAAEALWSAATALPLVGILSPGAVRVVFLAASYAASPIGWVLSHIVLAAAYYLVLTPIGLTMRLFGHDPLKRRFEQNTDSYWAPRESGPTAERYFRQF